jgi:hypothetical protein
MSEKTEPKPKKWEGKRGAPREHMLEMTARRLELAKTDPSKKGGRARTRYRKHEIEEHALKKLWPKALAVLEQQLESPDERVRQKAALEVIAYVKGKPTQTQKVESNETHTIVYESAAWMPVIDLDPVETPELDPAA